MPGGRGPLLRQLELHQGAQFFIATGPGDAAAAETIKEALHIALAYGGALSLRDLLSSMRLQRLALEVLVERAAAKGEPVSDGDFDAIAMARLLD